MNFFINYNKPVHYSISIGCSYVGLDNPVKVTDVSYDNIKFPIKGDHITIYKTHMDVFHMNGISLVWDGKNWCPLCTECKTPELAKAHDMQLKRNGKLNELGI